MDKDAKIIRVKHHKNHANNTNDTNKPDVKDDVKLAKPDEQKYRKIKRKTNNNSANTIGLNDSTNSNVLVNTTISTDTSNQSTVDSIIANVSNDNLANTTKPIKPTRQSRKSAETNKPNKPTKQTNTAKLPEVEEYRNAVNDIIDKFKRSRITRFTKTKNVSTDDVHVHNDKPIWYLVKIFKKNNNIRTRTYHNLPQNMKDEWIRFYEMNKQLKLMTKAEHTEWHKNNNFDNLA